MSDLTRKISFFLFSVALCLLAEAQTPQPLKRLLRESYMRGASLSLIVRDIHSGETVYAYDTTRQLTPASVMKLITTATALEILGADYRYPTTVEYSGTIEDGTLRGDLFIRGSGDPSLGSSHFEDDETFPRVWIEAIRAAGIREISGAVVADESIFDTEGTSPKWVVEDMGSYYGAGSYGLNIFDNLYRLHLRTGAVGTRPHLNTTEPEAIGIQFHNYLTCQTVPTDSSFIVGAPFSTERYLYGIVPANRERYTLRGDLPDPPLFLATYLTVELERAGIRIGALPSCSRLRQEAGEWRTDGRTEIITTYSPTLREIVTVTNQKSHNLFADALIKTIGLRHTPRTGEALSSFERGIRTLRTYWREKGLDLSDVWMYDGSGLAVTNKLSTAFLADLLCYMRTGSQVSDVFSTTLPQAGVEGSVRNFLRGSTLQGHARLKSGSMSRIKCYAGYIEQDGREYAIALIINQYDCEGRRMTQAIERLLTQLFE